MSLVNLVWKRSDPWAKKLGAPREIEMGEFYSPGQAHDAIQKLVPNCYVPARLTWSAKRSSMALGGP